MKKGLLALLILFAFADVFAQQDAQFIGYRQNGLVINPAYAGSREVGSLMAYYRTQWVNIDSAPKTFSTSIHGAVKNVGLGLWIENDRVNIHSRTYIMTSYAYRIKINKGKLSLGLQAGLMHNNSLLTEIENVAVGDNLLANDQSKWLPNFGLGVFYYTNRTYIGFSIPHLIESSLLDKDLTAENIWVRHYFATIGTVINAGSNLKLKPTALLKMVKNAPVSADIGLSFLFDNKFDVGVNYRWKESLDFLFSWQINRNLMFGYGFDFTLSSVSKPWYGGTHDVFVRYEFGFMKEKVVTPRYF